MLLGQLWLQIHWLLCWLLGWLVARQQAGKAADVGVGIVGAAAKCLHHSCKNGRDPRVRRVGVALDGTGTYAPCFTGSTTVCKVCRQYNAVSHPAAHDSLAIQRRLLQHR